VAKVLLPVYPVLVLVEVVVGGVGPAALHHFRVSGEGSGCQSLGSIERCERNVTLSTLETLAAALKSTVPDLLTVQK
jgi:hypothetical protein